MNEDGMVGASNKSSAFFQEIPNWISFEQDFHVPPAFQRSGDDSAPTCLHHLTNLNRRFREGVQAPVRMAIFGPTGAGKSKLLCSLTGRHVTRSGFHRPCTRHSVYFLHTNWEVLRATLRGAVETHDDRRFENWILIDTPDFDSISEDNLQEAERIFHEADCYLFVTDALKYADASTWEYMKRIVASGKRYVVGLNKVNSESIVEDFRQRFRHECGDDVVLPKVVVIPELPLDDDQLIPANHAGVIELNEALSRTLKQGQINQIHHERFREDLTRLFRSCHSRMELLHQTRQASEDLRRQLNDYFAHAKDRLRLRLATDIDPAIKAEVFRRVQERFEAIDLLRYPRKLMAIPVQGLRSMFSRWLPRHDTATNELEAREINQAISSQPFQLLESVLIDACERIWQDFTDASVSGSKLTRAEFRKLCMDHEELAEIYQQHYATFCDWAAAEARSTAAELTGQNKVKFILAQIMFNTVLVGVQVQTGGAFTVLEFGFDGVISPIVAKAIGLALSSEKVKEFEGRVHERHQELLAEILMKSRTRFIEFLEHSVDGLNELESHSQKILSFVGLQDQIANDFCDEPTRGKSSAARQEASKGS